MIFPLHRGLCPHRLTKSLSENDFKADLIKGKVCEDTDHGFGRFSMKHIFHLSLIVLTIACSKTDTTPVQQKVASVTLKTISTNTFWIGESDAITLNVELKDDKGATISNFSGKISYLVNGTALTSNTLNPTTEGTYDIKAQVENISSTNAIILTAKSPQKELDKIVMTSGFYQKYAVWHTMTGTKPELSVKGFDKQNNEIPIQKGLKALIGTSEVTINTLTFDKAGTQKIVASAYGKQADMTFEVRSPRTFEVVRLPIVFHVSKGLNIPSNADILTGKLMEKLNATYRNKLPPYKGEAHPNQCDTFIEFDLVTEAPDGTKLKNAGINFLPYTLNNKVQSIWWPQLTAVTSVWSVNKYINIFVYPDSSGIGGSSSGTYLDIEFKKSLSEEMKKLPIIDFYTGVTVSYSSTFNSANSWSINNLTSIHLGISSFINSGYYVAHEIGHQLRLRHTFEFGCDKPNLFNREGDGCFDTPIHKANFPSDYSRVNCSEQKFTSANCMDYSTSILCSPIVGQFWG